MLHKSSTYCPRQMLSSSLIFSLGAMKVNLVFVSILIIATSLAIHTSVHSYLAITLALGCSELGSYHSPHTFSKVSLPVIMWRSELRLILWPAHLLSKVSSSFIGGCILFQLRYFKVALKFSTTIWTMGEITATEHIKRESCGTLLAILHLDFYVWSFYAFHHCA